MASCRSNFHRVLSLVPLLTLLWQGPVKHCIAIQVSSVHTTMATPGAHCPLMLASEDNAKPPTHHCDMQQHQRRHQCELRCACHTGTPISTWDDSVGRYLLPQATIITQASHATFLWVPSFLNVHDIVVFPPDPPPRFSPLVSA